MPIRHAWYSKKSNTRRYLTPVWYGTPDGKCVKICFITDSSENSGTNWDDVEYVGKVDTDVYYGINRPDHVPIRSRRNKLVKESTPPKILKMDHKTVRYPRELYTKLSCPGTLHANIVDFWEELMSEKCTAETEPSKYDLGSHVVKETFESLGDLFFFIENEEGIRKWVREKDILNQVQSVGRSDAMSAAFAKAKQYFLPAYYERSNSL